MEIVLGLEHLLREAIDLRLRDDDALGLAVVDVPAGGLRRQPAFGERARRERV
ncbi:MAG: hypothetical protein U1F17_06230 [Burkholderiaceae bacterium]